MWGVRCGIARVLFSGKSASWSLLLDPVYMGKESNGKAYPQVVKLDKAFKLAETWVSNMCGSTSEAIEVEFETRPPRLGLGAKVTRHVQVAASNDPVERKLIGKLGVGKRQSHKALEHSDVTKVSELGEDFDDESDSRANVFNKKREVPPTSLLPKKKRKGTKSNSG